MNYMDKVVGEQKPKKEIDHVVVRKHKTGHTVEHHHTAPGHHPAETHALSNMDELHGHMEDHMGEPNPGEAEADAGQHGIPPAMAGPMAPPAGPAAA
jgi:hypothetical protein